MIFFYRVTKTYIKKVRRHKVNIHNKMNEEDIKYLMKAVLELKTVEECEDFFRDLCTVPEMISLSQRLRVAKLLSDDMIYSDVTEQTGASTATISRVNRALNYGSGGYRLVLKRMKEKESKKD